MGVIPEIGPWEEALAEIPKLSVASGKYKLKYKLRSQGADLHQYRLKTCMDCDACVISFAVSCWLQVQANSGGTSSTYLPFPQPC